MVTGSDGFAYCLDGDTGEKVWAFRTGPSGGWTSMTIAGGDNTVLVGTESDKNYLYALDGATGDRKWRVEIGGWIYSSPSIGANGMVYVGAVDGKLYAISLSQ